MAGHSAIGIVFASAELIGLDSKLHSETYVNKKMNSYTAFRVPKRKSSPLTMHMIIIFSYVHVNGIKYLFHQRARGELINRIVNTATA